jgi:23S rRNA (cytidine2498-2'-O)-methyltransferase
MPEPGGGTHRIFITTPGFESALVAELPPPFARVVSEGPLGIVPIGEPGDSVAGPIDPTFDPVFARQQLPHATEIRGVSVAALAEGAYAHAESAVDQAAGPFTIHTFTPTGTASSLEGRAALVAAELLGRLRERRRRAARWYREPESAAATFAEIKVLVQLLMIDRDRAWVSVAMPEALPRGGWTLAPWPGGVAPIAEDRRPPSRAYRKLQEAFMWMGAAPRENESCVDLGGAPGGWSYVALARGARVIAVDRAPLHPSLLGDPHLTMIEGNAFAYEPPAAQTPIDWLLCDVICEPARAGDLIDRWLLHGWCRRMVVSVKFKGRSGYGVLAEVRATLERHGCALARIKHLHNNKNEVTVMAAATLPPPPENRK